MSDLILAKQFLDTIPKAMRVIRAEMRQIARENLTIPQFRVLAILSGNGKTTSAEVCERIGISAPSMCRMAGYLAKKGLITTTRSVRDRRQVYLELTPEGRARFNSIKRQAQLRFKANFQNLAPEKKNALQNGLGIIESVFGNETHSETARGKPLE